MGCNIFNNLYKPEVLDEKKSLTLVSDLISNDFNCKNKKLQIINENININIYIQTKDVNISPNVSITKDKKPFIFVKFRPKLK